MKWIVEQLGKQFDITLPDRIINGQTFTATLNGKTMQITWHSRHRTLHIHENGGCERILRLQSTQQNRPGQAVHWNSQLSFATGTQAAPVHLKAKLRVDAPGQEGRATAQAAAGTVLEAPMTGKVLQVIAESGKAVREGDTLLVIEAMKMENRILASDAGTIQNLKVQTGDLVKVGDELLTIK